MRLNHEDASSFNTQWKSGRFSHSHKILTADVEITLNGSIVNALDPNGADRRVTLPRLEAGRFFAVANVGAANNLMVVTSTGVTLNTLTPGETLLAFASEVEWVGVNSPMDLTVFGYTGPGHKEGLVPDPGPGPVDSDVNKRRYLSELGWSTVAGVAAGSDYFYQMKGGTVTLIPLGANTLEFKSTSTALKILANAGTSPQSINFTVDPSGIPITGLGGYDPNLFVDHSTVVLTAGLGLSGGGTIAASRTFDFAPNELTVNPAPVVGDYVLMDLAAGGPRRTLLSSLNAVIDHNTLFNYVANRHIDHTAVSIVASTGLSGGGDITTFRSPRHRVRYANARHARRRGPVGVLRRVRWRSQRHDDQHVERSDRPQRVAELPCE